MNMEDFAFVRPRPLAAAVMSPKKIFIDASRYISTFWTKDGADWYCADNQNTAARTRDRGLYPSHPAPRNQPHQRSSSRCCGAIIMVNISSAQKKRSCPNRGQRHG